MKLLITPTSPFARKARVLIAEKNLDCPQETVSPWDDDPQVTNNNPLRKVPVLLTGNGAIVDSDVICEYLDAAAAPHFIPQDAAARTTTKTRNAIAQGGLESAVAIIMAGKVAPDMQNENWRNWLMNKTDNAIAWSEKTIPDRDADNPDMADITLACFLDFLNFRMPDHNWRAPNPKLAEWFEKIITRPSFAQTDPR